MSPEDITSIDTSYDKQIHVTVNSFFFGFIDDLYMVVENYKVDLPQIAKLSLQSQLRMGSSDFMQNYDHIKIMLDCLNKAYDNSSQTPAPCSIEN